MQSTPSESFWFLNSLVLVRVAGAQGRDNISILDHRVPFDDSPPLHIHRTEDEIFHILEGEFRFLLEDLEFLAVAGDIFVAPKGKPHTYRVVSPSGGRFLTITTRGDFENLVRAMGRPAERLALPEPILAPTPTAVQALIAAATTHGIEIVGPPLATTASPHG